MKNDGFFEKVYHVVRQIPFGKVTTYGAIANYLASSGSAQMVGWAMNASHVYPDIPAHRVVNRNGLLTGKHHFQGTNLMQQLLENEGIRVVNNQVVDFKLHLWIPSHTEVKLHPAL
jgi:methylated-DNA-protein-cysteine methyltransferase-like protein